MPTMQCSTIPENVLDMSKIGNKQRYVMFIKNMLSRKNHHVVRSYIMVTHGTIIRTIIRTFVS